VDNISYVADPHQGAVFDGFKIQPRQVTLVLRNAGDLTNLHYARGKLDGALLPDLDSGSPFTLVYGQTGKGSNALHLSVYYAGGMDFTPQYNSEAVALRLFAPNPFWRAETSSSAILSTSAQLPDGCYIYYRQATVPAWTTLGDEFLNGTSDGQITGLAATSGLLYVSGYFDNIGGVSASRVAVWDGFSWSEVGGGLDSAAELAVGPGDKIYAGGDFTTAGGSPANRVAVWDGSTWSPLGSGVNDAVNAITVGPDGKVYVGGQFDTAGGVSASYIAVWDGSSWSDLGGGMNARVSGIVVGADGTVYACGYFTTAGGNTVNYIAAWDGSSWSDLGGGLDNYAYDMAIAPDGKLYVVGTFTTAGSQSVDGVAVWDGVAWAKPPGLDLHGGGSVFKILVTDDGLVYLSGDFLIAGYNWFEDAGFACYNGATVFPPDIELPPAAYQQYTGPLGLYQEKLVVAGYAYTERTVGSGSPVAAGGTGVIAAGDAYAFPSFIVAGPGVIRSIRNNTTGDELLLNLPIQDGETVTINLDPLNKSITSDWRGNVLRYLLPNSDFATWHLAGGLNAISVFVADSGSTTSASLVWYNAWWSLDGIIG